ncbi:hypothetical protein U3Z00_003606 [Salmonella enterica]|nr:hypothetical protein [Salmonella enterica]EMA5837138.1 hypothetical protein [Salmonella enterica]EMA6041255.1 hypothetical protein [Salmonella enterica]
MPGYRKHRLFTSLSRRCRRKKVILLKNLLRQERHRCGGIYYDACDISPVGDKPDRIWGWSDICFTGLDPVVLWNAEIITAQMAFNDAVHAQAFDETRRLLNKNERENEFRMETRPNYDAKGKILSHTMVFRKPSEYAIFGGLTFSQYVHKREQEIARDDPPIIHCCYRFLPNYAYGLGLQMIVDAPSLSQQIIEAAISDFRLRGECEWHSPKPVSVEMLRLFDREEGI